MYHRCIYIVALNKYAVLKLNDLRRIHVEITTKCNARCPMCMRNYRGGDFNAGYPVTELTLPQFQQIITREVIEILKGQNDVDAASTLITFNGNLGDFCAASQGIDIVEYLAANQVPVVINTNGSLRNSSWWQRLAKTGATVGFALDGLEGTHELHRQDTDWNTIIRNAKTFIEAGGCAVWRFAPFVQNQHQEQDCRKLASELGFQKFENIYDGRDKGPVFDRTGRFTHHLGSLLPTESAEPPPWPDLVKDHVTWYHKDRVRHDKDTAKLDIRCIHKQNREIYLAADGTVYPCCFLGFYPQTMTHPGNSELKQLMRDNNALEVGLEKAMAWFDRVEESWKHNSIREGRTYQCVATCNRA